MTPAVALGHAIATQAETIEGLRDMVRDAVRCHFGDGEPRMMPKVIRLHFVRYDGVLKPVAAHHRLSVEELLARLKL